MSLKQYARKRDFTKTPEPGPKRRAVGAFRFVVQKHRSSHFHYDLRLEHRGVLLSWAVPKGISTNPSDKRLAVQVEDHPFEYKDFEGLIPKGNYGAGSVIIWDEGTYSLAGPAPKSRAEAERRMTEALGKGHLSVSFKGKKLCGEYSLVKLRSGDNQWLIIKKADECATAAGITDERSVRSGRTLEDMEKDDPGAQALASTPTLAGIDFTGAIKSAVPTFVEPMLATLVEEPFDRGGWIFEVKWDGYRSIAIVKNGKPKLFSRAGKVFTGKFPAIEATLKGLPFDAVFDGEIAVLDEKGRSEFQMLQDYLLSRKGRLVYYVFDCLYAGSYDLRQLPLERRMEILEKVLPVSDTVRLSGHVAREGKKFFRAAEKNGLEGIMAKDLSSRYLSGVRSQEWLKIKAMKRQEAVVGGFTSGRASRKYFGALVLGLYKEGALTFVGHAGTGFDERGLAAMHAKLKPLATDQCPFERKPRTNMPVTWVKPEVVVEVKFREWTKDGLMRQPVVLGLSTGKDPMAVVYEEPGAESIEKTIQSKRVRLTNLYKVFWPKERLTKKDLIRYYWRMADWVLPYLKDRPQSLNRYPDGIDGEHFFQKNMGETAPEWAETVKIEEGGKENTYLLCQNTDALLYMANLGCIELNVWSSIAGRLDKPDYVVFDFDPVEAPFSRVVEAVLATKQVLDEVKAPSFCKTSGATGMHIYVPIKPLYTYDQAMNFAHLVNIAVRQRLPLATSLERDPAKRRGLVYLDYLQNRYGATVAAPYSLRPRRGATVSTPLDWSEVNARLAPEKFNIRTVPKRMEKIGDPWKSLFRKRLDLAKALNKFRLPH
jgi:bifunctional non-homologous end joining protein LigD